MNLPFNVLCKQKDPFYEVKGVITLEDIVEAFLGIEVMDETDALGKCK